MATLNVTTESQVNFPKEVLQHLGIEPGGKIQLDLLPGGRARLSAAQPKGSISDLRGFLRAKTNGRKLSIEEIVEATTEAGF